MRRPVLIFGVVWVFACSGAGAKPGGRSPGKVAAIAHGGVGSPPAVSDGPRKAVDAALAVMEAGGDPLDAAVAGVVVMEDDPRFNAGTGSKVRLDGKTVQMDAAVMRSDGRYGAVAVIQDVRNPVLVARAVADTPHRLIAGAGAIRFARALGFPPHDPTTLGALEQSARLRETLRKNDPSLPASWQTFDWRKAWNFERTLRDAGLDPGSDTVGVAVRGADGTFGVALSTGGWTILMNGRVGDVPILGAGLFAGPHGAVAGTGSGERIMDAGLAREVHRWLSEGQGAAAAAARGVDLLRGHGIGLIVIGRDDLAADADKPMAWAARELGSSAWIGPAPGAQ
jgi:isoaspartyl peptidase/L-asparaginase-like protein (Ntn-hydrolase superfamily)